MTSNFTSRKKRTSENHTGGKLQHHSIPQVRAFEQAGNLSFNNLAQYIIKV